MTHLTYFDDDSCVLADFQTLTSRLLDDGMVPNAQSVTRNIPIYDAVALDSRLANTATTRDLMAEWGWVLGQGPGVLVLSGAYSDLAVIDAASAAFEAIITREKAQGGAQADHFATAGANDRVWNSLQKLCEADPTLFARYFGNPAISAVCEAWLGPGYQMTAQVNLVRPGGRAQTAHRDYHLGFQSADVAAQFPAHVHDLSPVMTLQGAIAHCDMPVESGPTKLLPFSHLYRPGYMAYRRDDFRAYFEEKFVQLPLSKGDAVFFNPALFHGAGDNRSVDIHRLVNLVQVSSAFGRAMESVDRVAMCLALYPALQRLIADEQFGEPETHAAIASAAEGYSFPTNLDLDPPVGGLAPETQAALMQRALDTGMTPEEFADALDRHTARRVA